MDVGSLIIKTKTEQTLKARYQFSGRVAGIRGRISDGDGPQSGVQLDVTESVVAFTPPGALRQFRWYGERIECHPPEWRCQDR